MVAQRNIHPPSRFPFVISTTLASALQVHIGGHPAKMTYVNHKAYFIEVALLLYIRTMEPMSIKVLLIARTTLSCTASCRPV